MRLPILCTAVATAAVCALGTACSSSSSGTAQTAGGSSAVAGAKTGGSPAQSGGSGAATCKQLTYAQIQPLQVGKVTQVAVTPASVGPNAVGQQCVFSGPDDDTTVDIIVLRGSGAQEAYTEGLQSETDGQVDVAGVGDKASRDKGDDQINSIKGNLFCSVSLGADDSIPGVSAIESANDGTGTLSEAENSTIATALGTLCNRIYGSGNTTPDLSSLAAAGGAGSSGAPMSSSAPSS
jgi:hypothetical protein